MTSRGSPRQPWQRQVADAVTGVPELLDLLGISPAELPDEPDLAPDFPLRVPRAMVQRMTPGDPRDPILLQVLPRALERVSHRGFGDDPLEEHRFCPAPGLLQKYEGRALLLVTAACAMNCRFCFRRHHPTAALPAGEAALERALGCLAPSGVSEVVLSGGDPLMLDDGALGRLVQRIAALPAVRRVRLHTRLPVVVPERLTPELTSALTGTRLRPVLVLHANSPGELSPELARALGPLRAAGATLLAQSVLLRGVNDDVGRLASLCETLFDAGVLPYYLHALDRVRGAAHFAVPDSAARKLHRALAARMPGYLVPRLVRDRPGEPGKSAL